MIEKKSEALGHACEDLDELKKSFVREKGWYVPSLHEKYLFIGKKLI